MAARAPHGNEPAAQDHRQEDHIEGHGGHHGGAWKVAYADFVTAMMAFFLLLWLLGATTEKQRKAHRRLFRADAGRDRSRTAPASNGLFGGDSIIDQDNYPHKAGADRHASR